MAAPNSPAQTSFGALADVTTLPQLLRWRVAASPDGEAYRQFDAKTGRWASYSWREIDAEFERWRRAMAAEGLAAGERVAILMPNGIAHIAMDQAALSRGLVPVPMHAIDNPDSIAYIIADSGAALLFVDSVVRWQAIAAAGQPLDGLKRIVCADGIEPNSTDGRVAALTHWLGPAPPGAFAMPDVAVQPDDLAAIVYTSGTTGRPKGVMLSHDNVVSNVKAIHGRIAASHSDVFLSFLPLSHTFERTGGYYYAIAAGACVAYARSVALLADDLKQVRPTVLVSVPRIYERVWSAIRAKLDEGPPARKKLFERAVAVGYARFEHAQLSQRQPAVRAAHTGAGPG